MLDPTLSLTLASSVSLCPAIGGSPPGHQRDQSALQVWGWKAKESDEDYESEGKAAFRAFIEAMLADVL